jgi:hypothetical protein
LIVLNTDLDKYIGGNFDLIFDGYKIVIIVRFIIELVKGVKKPSDEKSRQKLLEGVAIYWSNSGFGLIRDNNGQKDFIPIYIYVQEVATTSVAHKILKIYPMTNMIAIVPPVQL